MNRKRGFTLIELLVVMAIIALLIGILLPALNSARRSAKLTKDSTQIRSIHQAWLTFSNEFNGIMPTPGLIRRQQFNGAWEPGRGLEDKKLNDTARLHSACIMNHYYTSDVCVGVTEPSANVVVMDDYNFEIFNIAANPPIYWDDTFAASLTINPGSGSLSNVSYASMPIAGERQIKQWKNTGDSTWPMICNRGVKDGSLAAGDYNNSMTLQIHGGAKQWVGNLCFNDNHVTVTKSFKPENVVFQKAGATVADNIFFNDSSTSGTNPDGNDGWLVINPRDSLTVAGQTVTNLTPTWD